MYRRDYCEQSSNFLSFKTHAIVFYYLILSHFTRHLLSLTILVFEAHYYKTISSLCLRGHKTDKNLSVFGWPVRRLICLKIISDFGVLIRCAVVLNSSSFIFILLEFLEYDF